MPSTRSVQVELHAACRQVGARAEPQTHVLVSCVWPAKWEMLQLDQNTLRQQLLEQLCGNDDPSSANSALVAVVSCMCWVARAGVWNIDCLS